MGWLALRSMARAAAQMSTARYRRRWDGARCTRVRVRIGEKRERERERESEQSRWRSSGYMGEGMTARSPVLACLSYASRRGAVESRGDRPRARQERCRVVSGTSHPRECMSLLHVYARRESVGRQRRRRREPCRGAASPDSRNERRRRRRRRRWRWRRRRRRRQQQWQRFHQVALPVRARCRQVSAVRDSRNKWNNKLKSRTVKRRPSASTLWRLDSASRREWRRIAKRGVLFDDDHNDDREDHEAAFLASG